MSDFSLHFDLDTLPDMPSTIRALVQSQRIQGKNETKINFIVHPHSKDFRKPSEQKSAPFELTENHEGAD